MWRLDKHVEVDDKMEKNNLDSVVVVVVLVGGGVGSWLEWVLKRTGEKLKTGSIDISSRNFPYKKKGEMGW